MTKEQSGATLSRPPGVAVLAAVYVLGGGIYVAHSLYLIGIATPVSALATALGFADLGFALVVVVAGAALWSGRGWAWRLTFGSTVVGMLLSVVLLFEGSLSFVIDILVGLWVLWYLWQPYVKAYFRMS